MNQLMTPQAVARKYGVPLARLARWRRQNTGPAYYRLGPRTVRYPSTSLDDWFTGPRQSRAARAAAPETTRDRPQPRH